jgi:uncharacterized protein (TIGR03000 family)
MTSETRSFETPSLPAGKEYLYTLRAEGMSGGRPVLIEKKVKFRAGKQIDVDLRPDFDLREVTP